MEWLGWGALLGLAVYLTVTMLVQIRRQERAAIVLAKLRHPSNRIDAGRSTVVLHPRNPPPYDWNSQEETA